MVGAMSVDRPVTRRRPDARQRSLLERYAAQAERAVITAFEREELVRQVAHAESARQLIRSAAIPAQASLEAVLELVHRPLVDGFGASGSWIQVLEDDGRGRGYVRDHDGEPVPVSDRMLALAHQLAPMMWADQRIVVVTEHGRTHAPPHAAPLVDEARRQLVELGLSSALGISLGVGTQCVGFLVLGRSAQDPAWSPGEINSAIQIGHDLGATLMTARALERERNMVQGAAAAGGLPHPAHPHPLARAAHAADRDLGQPGAARRAAPRRTGPAVPGGDGARHAPDGHGRGRPAPAGPGQRPASPDGTGARRRTRSWRGTSWRWSGRRSRPSP